MVEELRDSQVALKKDICRLLANIIQKPILLDAFGLNEKDMFIPTIRKMYAKHGLLRERRILLLRKGPHILSCAIVEVSSAGINLSGILNSFRIYNLARNDRHFNLGKRKLIRRVLDLHRSISATKAILLTSEANLSLYLEAGFIKSKEYVCFTGAREAFMPFREFMEQNYGSRRQLIKFMKCYPKNEK